MFSTRLLLLFCVTIWGWTFIATKICLAYVNPYELVGLRFMIGLPILLGIILTKKMPIGLSAREVRTVGIGGTIMIVHFILQATALNYTTATNTGWIIAVAPLAVAVLSFFLLNEKIGAREMMGVTVASAGILLLISKGDLHSLGWLRSRGDWMILLSAFTWAIYTVVIRDVSRARPPLVVTLYVFLPVLLVCLGYMALTSRLEVLTSLTWQPIVALFFLGTLGTAAQWFWQEGVARVGASKAGIFLYLEPVATTVLAVPLLGEPYGKATAVGGLLVLTGVWWAERK